MARIGRIYISRLHDGRLVAMGDTKDAEAQSLINKMLAAPELLEALAGLRTSIGRMPADMSRPGWCEIVTALFEADAAIAKAKGEA